MPGPGGQREDFDDDHPQPRPSPPVLRRALVFVSTDAPPTAILTIAFGR